MRIGLIGSSLVAMSLMLSTCGSAEQNAAQPANVTVPDQPQWSEANAGQLRAAIAHRATHGLDRMKFGSAADPGAPLDDAKLTELALTYAGALARGATDPSKLFAIYSLPRPQPDLRKGLADALKAGNVGVWIESLAPQGGNYRKLSAAYLALIKQGGGGAAAISPTDTLLKPGMSDPRVPAIAAQLVAFGYLDAGTHGRRYTAAMARAVQQMQADYGIRPDGVIGGDTLQILNLSGADRARAIAVNMERMRWLQRDPPATRIDVNIAAARLTYWRDGEIADTRKVVVGKPDTATPQLGSPIVSLVANPTWTIPRSIERKEIAGKGAGYLRRHNMVWKNGRIVQQSGPDNSLGLVKFDMQNPHAIYLHDTPAKQLFDAIERQRSHGCVRVDDALGFAEMLAGDEGVLDQWQEASGTDKETFVKLPHAIPVRLLYQTVLFDAQGEPVTRSDPYGWNDRVAKALGFDVGGGRRVMNSYTDIAP
ncbi:MULTISPECIES: L,D-transpeptidase family protein [unclassified Sphingomonas]|uniref:L,D-transpeptidase family protein n=1 Tax=unclassified Sphingomonas TaxID=196159 RepID=UPI000A90F968|nr:MULTISPECIES: L,D-transpeptidase family protein [unclassified Sphingomonas]